MGSKVRVRFAPSPTGHLHIGGVRTALFNYVFARKMKGDFILRVEDTDLLRSKKEYVDSILASIEWLGFSLDEEPYFQSSRLDIYRKYAQELINAGKAYYCICTKEDIKREKEEAQKAGRSFAYSGRCRGNKKYDEIAAIRLCKPDAKQYLIQDMIRGEVSVNSVEFDDFIIMKSDGTPTYSFACVVDDDLLGITHVIRGEDHITNTFKQLIIYDLYGWAPPEFAHIPLINGPDGKRLSKRHGATALIEYKTMGFLREPLLNYLSLLGWSPKNNEEIFDMEYLFANFDFAMVSKNPAQFRIEKLTWMNGEYLFNMNIKKKTEILFKFIKEFKGFEPDKDLLLTIVSNLGDRGKTLEEIWEKIDFFFIFNGEYQKAKAFESAALLYEVLEKCEFSIDSLEIAIKEFCEVNGVKLRKAAEHLRLGVSGKKVTPGLFETLFILGKDETLKRLSEYEIWLKRSL